MKLQIIIVTIRLLTKISSSNNKNKEESIMGEGEAEAVLTIQMLKILTGDGNSLFLYFSINIAFT
jgi:hypothetical protein